MEKFVKALSVNVGNVTGISRLKESYVNVMVNEDEKLFVAEEDIDAILEASDYILDEEEVLANIMDEIMLYGEAYADVKNKHAIEDLADEIKQLKQAIAKIEGIEIKEQEATEEEEKAKLRRRRMDVARDIAVALGVSVTAAALSRNLRKFLKARKLKAAKSESVEYISMEEIARSIQTTPDKMFAEGFTGLLYNNEENPIVEVVLEDGNIYLDQFAYMAIMEATDYELSEEEVCDVIKEILENK